MSDWSNRKQLKGRDQALKTRKRAPSPVRIKGSIVFDSRRRSIRSCLHVAALTSILNEVRGLASFHRRRALHDVLLRHVLLFRFRRLHGRGALHDVLRRHALFFRLRRLHGRGALHDVLRRHALLFRFRRLHGRRALDHPLRRHVWLDRFRRVNRRRALDHPLRRHVLLDRSAGQPSSCSRPPAASSRVA